VGTYQFNFPYGNMDKNTNTEGERGQMEMV